MFNGYLYTATESYADDPDGVEIWRTNDGVHWNQTNTPGFGDLDNFSAGGMAVYQGYLYVGMWNITTGAQLWRSNNGTNWEQVTGDGFGDINNWKVESVYVFDDALYAGINNDVTGSEVWRTSDGIHWGQINPDGFGDSNNASTFVWSNGTTAFQDNLYYGTRNGANGGEVWQLLPTVYLPFVRK